MSMIDINRMNILDLPDEILVIMINELNMIDVLYSLVGVNEKFDRLVFDPLYINHLDLTIKSLFNKNFQFYQQIFSKICEEILL